MYRSRDGSFELCLDKTSFELSHLNGKYGPIEAIDLFVGCDLDILGRVVTLRQADSVTTAWLDAETKRLLKGRRRRPTSLRVLLRESLQG